jgi:hypothetical protein
MAVDIFDREVAINRLALIHHPESDTHTLCRSDTRFYDADQTHMMSNLFLQGHGTVSRWHALLFEQ